MKFEYRKFFTEDEALDFASTLPDAYIDKGDFIHCGRTTFMWFVSYNHQN